MRLDLGDVLPDFVRDSTKENDLLVGFVVTDDTKAMITDIVHPLTGHGVFDDEPNLLVKQEQDQIVEERSLVLLTQLIISATCDEQRTVARQVAHRMTESRSGRLTLGFDRGEFSMYDLSVDDNWLEVSQLVL